MRPDLCRATGLHDAGPDGRCRDCRRQLHDDDPVADPTDGFTTWLHEQQARPPRPAPRTLDWWR